MHVDLIESLRCPRRHEDGWLVAATDEVIDRQIVRGTLGCPICGGEWRIQAGELDFGQVAFAVHETAGTDTGAAHELASAESHAMRLAALLDLRDANGFVVLTGESALVADTLHSLTGVRVLAVNASRGAATRHSRLRVANALPLGVGTARGVVLDSMHGDSDWLDSAVRAVARGGRVVAPTHVHVPSDVEELARDEREWVGAVRVAASGLVPLRRGGDPMGEISR